MPGDLTVMVLDSRMPFAPALVRCLTTAGIEVVLADTFQPAVWRGAALRVSAPASDPAGFSRDVARCCRQRRVDVVLPLLESGLFLDRSILPPSTLLMAPEPHVGWRLHDKATFIDLAAVAGIRCPDAVRSVPTAPGDVVVRPRFGRAGEGMMRLPGGELTTDVLNDRALLVTRWVPGRDFSTLSVVDRGRVTAEVSYIRRPHLERDRGLAVQRLDRGPGLEESRALIAASGVRDGFIGFDFRASDGSVFALECNPRPTPGVLLLEATVDTCRSVRWKPRDAVSAMVPGAETGAWTRDWRPMGDITADLAEFEASSTARSAGSAAAQIGGGDVPTGVGRRLSCRSHW